MKIFFNTWKYYILSGLGIVALTVFLRLYNLNELPIFGDEAIYIRWAQVMRAEPTLRFLPLSDGKQPLFMWMVIPFQKVLSDPLIAGRVVSALAGLGTTIGVFMLTMLLFNKGNKDNTGLKIGLIAAFIYAISPLTVFFDRMALVDSILTLFGVWGLIFFLLAVKHYRFDFAMLAGFAFGAALLTKSPGLFFLLMLPILWLFYGWPQRKRLVIRGLLVKLLRLSILSLPTYLIALAMYNILRLGTNFHLLSARTKDYIYPISHLWTSFLDPLKPYLDRTLEYFWIMGPGLVVIFFVLAWSFNLKKHWKQLLVLSVWGLVPIVVVSEFSKTMTARYILFSAPYLYIVAASVFLLGKRRLKEVIVLGLILFTLLALRQDFLLLNDIEAAKLPRSERSGYLEEWTAGTGIREISVQIREEHLINPDQKIVVGTEGYFGTLPNGLQAYLNDLPEITIIGVGTSFKEVPIQLAESKNAGNKTYFVVNSTRLEKEFDMEKVILLAAYSKAFRPDWTREYVQHGPRETLYLLEVK